MVVETRPGLVEGWRRREQVVTEKERGDTTETEEQPNSEEEEEVKQEWHPDRGSLNLELAAQYELAQERERLKEEREAAARGQGRSCRQRGADTEVVGCREEISVECQA